MVKFEQIYWESHLKIQDFLKDQILKYAEPPIKGGICVGKLKWRGIKRCTQPNTSTWWIEQRGKQLGQKIKIEIKFEGLDVIYL